MRVLRRFVAATALAGGTVAVALGGALAGPAGASTRSQGDNHRTDRSGADHAVFVATDNVAGNQVVAFRRGDDGRLTPSGTYDTDGLGGSLTGAVVDRTASQGALALDDEAGRLFAVNAGSDSVSVFSIHGDRLRLEQVVASGGSFPVSIATHDHLVEVLNARDGGSVQGFREFAGRLIPIPGSNRPLGLNPTATPEFTHTPGQVTFSPDGSQVLVTTKAGSNAVDTFAVRWDGRLSATPTVTTFPGDVPFAITFDRAGHAVIALAGSNAVATAKLHRNGTLSVIESSPTGQAATCWIVRAGNRFYASNAGSASLTGFDGDRAGHLSVIGNTATDAGTVDAAATPDGRFVYVQGGKAGVVDGFAVNADGTLTPVGTQTVPGAAGAEGIVAI